MNERGSDYIRELVEAEKTIKFLEKFKKKVKSDEEIQISSTIDIILKYLSKP